MSAQWLNARNLKERILVTGQLTLQTPAHFGSGEGEGLLDMPLHLDPLEGRALLAGTSLTGALRSYVHQHSAAQVKQLFGEVDADMESDRTVRRGESRESMLIVDDALGPTPIIEWRDGVAIDPKTRTAEDEKKFDMELLAAGTTFELSFELMVPQGRHEQALVEAFAYALQGLEDGRIRLGKRKRRGFGECMAHNWQVERFDMTTKEEMIAWLRHDPEALVPEQPDSEEDIPAQAPAIEPEADRRQTITELLGVEAVAPPTPICAIRATCRIDGSLLIRSTPTEGKMPDTVHLHSHRDGQDVPVLSGTSIAGALRARALRIGNTLSKGDYGYQLADELFGYRPKDKRDDTPMTASRIWVDEMVVEKPLELVQSRVKIDRFTGGSYPGALFNEQPLFGTMDTRVTIQYMLTGKSSLPPQDRDPLAAYGEEIGLLLLLLKDLWTGDLPLGGEISIGRGRLRGESATIQIGEVEWTIQQGPDGKLIMDDDATRKFNECVSLFAQSAKSQATSASNQISSQGVAA